MQAEKLVYYENSGSIHACLVYRGPEKNADRFIEEQDRILKEMRQRKASDEISEEDAAYMKGREQ